MKKKLEAMVKLIMWCNTLVNTLVYYDEKTGKHTIEGHHEIRLSVLNGIRSALEELE